MKIASAGNVEIPAILALETLGLSVFSKVINDEQEMLWTATGNGNEYIAGDPLALLGLVKLSEVFGDQWAASDGEIDRYALMLEGDA